MIFFFPTEPRAELTVNRETNTLSAQETSTLPFKSGESDEKYTVPGFPVLTLRNQIYSCLKFYCRWEKQATAANRGKNHPRNQSFDTAITYITTFLAVLNTN